MTIRIYPSTLPGNPANVVAHGHCTIGEWVSVNVPAFNYETMGSIQTLTVNGDIVACSLWAVYRIRPEDQICVRPEAKGGAFDAIGSIVSSVFQFVGKLFGIQQPNVPDYNKTSVQGSELQGANVEANTAKRNEAIAEVAGSRRIYPSYLCPPHKYFVTQEDGSTAQFIDLMLCVAKGKFQILAEDQTIGSTPILALGTDATTQIFQPGETVTSNRAHQHWYSAPEVGATSTGGAGLELRATTDVDRTADVTAVTYAGDTITAANAVQDGDNWTDAFPDGWTAGLTLRITQPQDVIFSSGNTLMMDFTRLQPEVGMAIEIVGMNAGEYLIESYTPATGEIEEQITVSTMAGQRISYLKNGTYSVTVGIQGLRYRIVTPGRETIEVERLDESGSVDTSWPGFIGGTYDGDDVSISLDEYSLQGDWTGPYYACPQGEVSNRIEYDVFFTGGLFRLRDDGNLRDQSVSVEFQYRDARVGGEWTSIVKTYTSKKTDQLGYTETIVLDSEIRPECRMRRVTAASNSTQITDDVEWYGLRTRLRPASSYPGVTTIAATIRGGERLASQSENKLSVVATRILPVRRNGEWQPEQPTREIDAWIAYAAKKAGYTDDELDLEELDRLGEIWRSRGDYYDAIIDGGTTRETIVAACAAGMSELTIDDGRIKPVRDELRDTPEYSFAADDITDDLEMRFEAVRPDDYDGIDVEYHDGTIWKNRTIECRAPGDLGRKVQKITLNYVTQPDQAYQIGMRRRMEQLYRRWGYTWGAHMTALNCNHGSYVAVTTDVPGYGMSSIMEGYVESGGNAVITISEPPDWTDSEQHFIGVKRPDGTLEGPIAVTPGPDAYSVRCPALSFVPDVSGDELPPRIHFGAVPWFNVLITKITPNESEEKGTTASIEAQNYDERIYQYDDAPAPESAIVDDD